MRPTMLGQMHFALRLAAGPTGNAEAWEKLPPLTGANKFRPDALAPNAVVLADAGGEDKPILVSQNYGDGRVLAFAGDSTWRWWMRGAEDAHKRFWRQIVLWLAKKDQSLEGSVWIKLDQRRFSPSQRVEFSAGARDSAGEPLKDGKFKAEIILPDGKHQPIELIPQEDQFTGTFRNVQTPGDYAVEVKVMQNGAEFGSTRARFVVFAQDLELDNPSANYDTMKNLAAMTGGESFTPELLGVLVKRLTEKTAQLETQQETKKTFWDTWSFFLTLVGLLSIEWYLRKRWGLV
jgi:hypothetical protein